MTSNPRQFVGDLWAALQEQQREIARLQAQLELQRKELTFRLQDLEGKRPPSRKQRLTRVGLLKAAAAGAVGLAGYEGLRPQSAFAGTDGDVQLGADNTTGGNGSDNNRTAILAASDMTGNSVFRADAYNNGANTANIDGLQGQGSGKYSGVFGIGGPTDGAGIFGQPGGMHGSGVIGVVPGATLPASLAAGVVGSSSVGAGVEGIGTGGTITYPSVPTAGIGVYGIGASGATGVYGVTADGSGTAVQGDSKGANGVMGRSTTWIGVTGSSASYVGVYGTGGAAVTGVYGDSSTGTGVAGFGYTSGRGVYGYSDSGTAVEAEAKSGVALYAHNDGGGYGVHAVGFPGFLAEGASYNGAHGRGGRFISQQAQIRLNPAGTESPPSTGQAAGDFFTASNGHLYYCQDGSTWVKLA